MRDLFLAVIFMTLAVGSVQASNEVAMPRRLAFILPEDAGSAEKVRCHAERAAADLGIQISFLSASLPWGGQTGKLVDAVYGDQISLLVGGFESSTAHLVEQIVARSKGKVLFITFSEDPTLTQINLPWVSRITPSSETLLFQKICSRLGESTESCSLLKALAKLSVKEFVGLSQQQVKRFLDVAPSEPSTSALEAFIEDALRLSAKLLKVNEAAPNPSLLRDSDLQGETGPLHFDSSGNRVFDAD